MPLISQSFGPMTVEWDELTPLRWTIRETIGEGIGAEVKAHAIDFTKLAAGYSNELLLALKSLLHTRRLQIAFETVHREILITRRILQKCHIHVAGHDGPSRDNPAIQHRIELEFLATLWEIRSEFGETDLVIFKFLYTANRSNALIYSPDLHTSDFPNSGDAEQSDSIRKRILASALNRAALVEILNVTEAAFDAGTLNFGRYVFCRLLLSRAARPKTYRQIRLKHLLIDTSGGTKKYFLTLHIPKARTTGLTPEAIVSIHPEVGILLEKQREAVAARLGNLVQKRNSKLRKDGSNASLCTIGDLPLFPSLSPRKLTEATERRLGMYGHSTNFINGYVRPLKALTGKEMDCTAIRHTMGTQMALAGCSAETIAAVLLHATSGTAKVYVDLIFEGVIDELSESLESAFESHFPVFKDFVTSRDPIPPEKRIVSHTVDRSISKTTGECGRRQICNYAPISCYECPRFKPCFDVDHSINLDYVNEEIRLARHGGLQRKTDLRRFSHIANRIRVVITLCELKRKSVDMTQSAVQVEA